jgi:transcriptional regulator with XRE-family HTH domain
VPSRPCTEFGQYVEQLLAARSLSLRSFAQRIGMSPGWVSRVKRLTIAPEHIEVWADALELRGAERERFIVLAWLTHAPPFIREYVATLERRLAGQPRARRSPRVRG